MIDTTALIRDQHGNHGSEVLELSASILSYIKDKKKCTMDDIYTDLECGDTTMYVAMHYLVEAGLITGDSPYKVGSPIMHNDMHYAAV